MNETARERIEENRKSKDTFLDLSKLGLTRIPEEIRDFVWLERLDLDQNKIAKIEKLDKLSRLRILSLEKNKIAKIEKLDKLTQLQKLYLDQNQILKIEGLDKLTQLQILYLNQNQILKIEGLDKLTELQELYLHQNKIYKIEGLNNLTQLQELYLGQNKIFEIEGLDKLMRLQQLELEQNQITKIKEVHKLTQLQILSLDQNQILKIEGLDKLTQLQQLYLQQNKIHKIEGLNKLAQLQILYLDQNQILKIEGLDKLTHLKILYLDQNKILKIEGLDKLTYLQILYLDQNQISKIRGLDKLTHLQILSLSQNQISKIENVLHLVNLEALDLSQTRIQELTPVVNWLQNSKGNIFWESSQTQWHDKPSKDPNYLSITFNLGPLGRQYYTVQKGLYLKNCHRLRTPSPEWVQGGKEIVLDYLTAASEHGTIELNEAKLMIVGRPHAGKTSASIKLRDSGGELPDSTDSTRGITIEDWIYEKDGTQYTAHLWDFGGQDIQYAIHQFFMTQRAIYLLVDCTRDPEGGSNLMGETKSEVISNYWLQNIKNLAKSSPTFYLYNLYEPYAKNLAVFNNLERQYGDFLHKYPLEVNLHQITTSNEAGIVPIRKKLQEAIAELPNVGLVLPTKWAAIKEVLTQEAQKRSYISLDKYFEISRDNGVLDNHSALLISRYFHEIGSLIHYGDDNTSPLYKLLILQRKWATTATYQVILDRQIREEQKGKFTREDLIRIWSNPDYHNMTAELLDLLQRFEICYQLPSAHPTTFLIPQCLPDQYPEGIDEHLEKPLSIRYDYEFLPYGIINRLTVRLHDYVHEDMVWKQGMVLLKGPGRVLVEERKNINKGYIEITVSGNKKDRWLLQEKVMEQLDDLNETMNLTEGTAIQVPCTCATCQEAQEVFLHDYGKLLGMLEENIDEERCGRKPFKFVKILDLIDHAFFTRPEAVKQSLQSKKLDFRGANIGKVVMGDSHDKTQKITTGDHATVQVAENEGQNTIEETNPEIPKTNLLEYFRVRKLAGWTAGAIAAAIIAYSFPLSRPWTGLIFIGILGWGIYTSLTSDGKYLRNARWVLLLGLGAAGILNGLPVIAGSFGGRIGTESNFIQFLGQFTLDEQPLVTIVLLVLTFGLAAFLVYKDQAGAQE